MPTRDEIARLVKDALVNLYDPVRLQSHELTQILALPRLDGTTDSETLRRYLRERIDLLRPPRTVPQNTRAWLGHQVLLLHYVRCLSLDEVCHDLNISQATFYRRQREATEALSSIVWDELNSGPRPAAALATAEPEHTRQRAIALASRMPAQSVIMTALMEGVAQTIARLAKGEGVALNMAVAEDLPDIWADEAMVRQALLALLSECVCRADGDRVVLEAGYKRNEVVVRIRMPGSSSRALTEIAGSQTYRTGIELLRVYRGRVSIAHKANLPSVCIGLSARQPQSVLIVDDDQETVNLYTRYLDRADYVVESANTADAAGVALARSVPDLVLLDVLLPRRDGWTVLNTLRSTPTTARVPVIVCSVIEQPELAISLGADRVLNKPISEQDLLVTVRQVVSEPLGRASSQA